MALIAAHLSAGIIMVPLPYLHAPPPFSLSLISLWLLWTLNTVFTTTYILRRLMSLSLCLRDSSKRLCVESAQALRASFRFIFCWSLFLIPFRGSPRLGLAFCFILKRLPWFALLQFLPPPPPPWTAFYPPPLFGIFLIVTMQKPTVQCSAVISLLPLAAGTVSTQNEIQLAVAWVRVSAINFDPADRRL